VIFRRVCVVPPALSWRLRRISGRSILFNNGFSSFRQLLWYSPPTFELSGDVPSDLWRSPARSSRTGKFPAVSGGLRRVGWRRLLLFGSGCLPVPMLDKDSWSRTWILPILYKDSEKTKKKRKEKGR
jgi:hypothetical protein